MYRYCASFNIENRVLWTFLVKCSVLRLLKWYQSHSDASMASYPSSPSPSYIVTSSPLPTLTMMIPSTLAPINIKLERSNYVFWKCQILPAARAHDLEAYLLGTKLKPNEVIINSGNPSATIVNPDYISWMRLDQFVMSWLLSSISEQMLGHVVQCKSAAEKIWIVLEQLFSTKSKARVLQLRLSLQTVKKGGGSIEDCILKMKSLATSLMAAGQQISDDELVLYILGEFESVIVNLLHFRKFNIFCKHMRIDLKASTHLQWLTSLILLPILFKNIQRKSNIKHK